jgi:host factor-I protein
MNEPHDRQAPLPGSEASEKQRPAGASAFATRKLVRPSLRDVGQEGRVPRAGKFRPAFAGEAPPVADGRDAVQRERSITHRPTPAEQTHAENFYYQKQMQSKTPMTLVLSDGEHVHGVIEWYDRSCLKLLREQGGNLLVYKSGIKYLYKKEL